MTKPALIHRLRTAAGKEKGLVLEHLELARVYTAARASVGPANEWVKRMRLKVLERAGFRLDADEVKASLELLDRV